MQQLRKSNIVNMYVTGIEEYKNNKYKIFLNSEFAFVLYKGELHKYGIVLNEEINEAVRNEIVDVLLLKRAKLRALNLLKSRDYTEKGLVGKLMESLYPDSVIERAIEYVKSYGYIDDLRYACSYVRCHKESKSSMEIKRKLVEKGVSAEYIEIAIDEEGSKEHEEMELIKSLISKKLTITEEPDYKEKNKLYAYMYRKGYSTDKVDRALSELLLDIT